MKTQEEHKDDGTGSLFYMVYFREVTIKLLTQEQYNEITEMISNKIESFNVR